MVTFISKRSAVRWMVLTSLTLGGCGCGDTMPETSQPVRPLSPATTPLNESPANQELQSSFDKVSPALINVRNARISLLRNGATFPGDAAIMRASASAYRESLQLLRRKFVNLEQEMGTETTKRLLDFIITNGFVMGAEIHSDIGADMSPQTQSLRHDS